VTRIAPRVTRVYLQGGQVVATKSVLT
jgi:hypothetical protein